MCQPNSRVVLAERETADVPLATQAQLLGVARSSLYYQKAAPSERETRLKHLIDRLYTDCPFYGSRRIAWKLGEDGHPISRRTAQRYMREMGLEQVAPEPNLSKRNLANKIYSYLLRGVTASYPNHVWGIEIVRTQMTKRMFSLVGLIGIGIT